MSTFRDQLHNEYGSQIFSDDSCFLCGNSENMITLEHVFPRWLQSLYGLEAKTISLLNGTLIQYKSLKIPCCQTCNNEHLSRLETKVANSVRNGYPSVNTLPLIELYYWAGKIFYSILRKEFSLLLVRSDSEKGNILDAELLESFSHLHLFLQGIRGKHRFDGAPPFSVLVCNLHDLGETRRFDFKDDLAQFALSVRMGEIGVIVTFQDCGLTNDTYGKYVEEVQGRKLHPIQFDELYAKICYQLHITNGNPKFLTATHVEGLHVATTNCFPSFQVGEWKQGEYVNWLLLHVSHWLSGSKEIKDHYQAPDRVSTWMSDGAGNLLLMALDQWESNPSFAS